MLSRALRGAPRPVNGYVCCSCLIQSQYTVQPRSYTSAATPAQDEASTGPAIIKKKGTSRLPHRRRIRKIGSSSKDGVRSATVQSGKPALPRKIVSKVVSKGQDEGISRANVGAFYLLAPSNLTSLTYPGWSQKSHIKRKAESSVQENRGPGELCSWYWNGLQLIAPNNRPLPIKRLTRSPRDLQLEQRRP
jgi:hypothetical protein